MGDIVIRLRGNAATGEREVLVDYEASPDATRLEHEQRHREIVERLVLEGMITREEVGAVVLRARSEPTVAGGEALRESA